jgi:hypothetical protein
MTTGKYGVDGLGGIDIPENKECFTDDLGVFGGMSQAEIEAEADREAEEERKKEFSE